MLKFTQVAVRSSRLVASLSIVGVTACATTVDLPPAPEVSVPETALVRPLPPYRVQIGDVLGVRLFLNPELNEEVAVRPDGKISTTLAQDVQAYGRTPAEITAELSQDYSTNLRKPQISVVVRSFAPNRVYVAGEVTNPGEFISVGPNLTVSQAIARAGGVKLSASRGKVFILRRGPDDKPQAYAVDYKAVISGANPSADVRLAQYDVVYVPRLGVADTYQYFNQYLEQFVPLTFGLSPGL